eukprot:gene18128-biopygen18705
MEMQRQQGEIQRQQAEEHRLLREQLQRQAEINVALEAKVAAKSGTSDFEGVTKTAEQLLERRRKLAYVPKVPVNPFPPWPATLTTRMPQLYDLQGNKTYDALSKKSNSSMTYECLVFALALSYLQDVVGECNATLDASEDGELLYDELQNRFHAVTNSVHGVYAMLCNRWIMLELRGQQEQEQEPGSSQRGGADALRAKLHFVEDRVYQAADGVVADEVLQQWLNDFDKNRGKAVMSATSKSAANADTRVLKDHRDQRWKERKKYDDEKDKKTTGKGGVAGRGEGETTGKRCVDESDKEVTRFTRLFGAKTGAQEFIDVYDSKQGDRGLKNRVFWKDDGRFYPGVMKEFNEDGKAHVLYDDADEETLDLSEENFKIICRSGVSELTDETADANGENIDFGGEYIENKRGGAVENFLTRSRCERWRSELGRSRFRDLALKMQQKALLDTTLNNYGPKARRFIHFCE